jgi:hypothetical protein
MIAKLRISEVPVSETQVGQQYQKVGEARSTWRVTAVGTNLEGIPHCHIVDVSDRTNIKLISEKTLTDRRFYRLRVEA